ncbi:MAG: hypothetical protein WC897_01840 [Candidatus Gracilibacteria bacterium]
MLKLQDLKQTQINMDAYVSEGRSTEHAKEVANSVGDLQKARAELARTTIIPENKDLKGEGALTIYANDSKGLLSILARESETKLDDIRMAKLAYANLFKQVNANTYDNQLIHDINVIEPGDAIILFKGTIKIIRGAIGKEKQLADIGTDPKNPVYLYPQPPANSTATPNTPSPTPQPIPPVTPPAKSGPRPAVVLPTPVPTDKKQDNKIPKEDATKIIENTNKEFMEIYDLKTDQDKTLNDLYTINATMKNNKITGIKFTNKKSSIPPEEVFVKKFSIEKVTDDKGFESYELRNDTKILGNLLAKSPLEAVREGLSKVYEYQYKDAVLSKYIGRKPTKNVTNYKSWPFFLNDAGSLAFADRIIEDPTVSIRGSIITTPVWTPPFKALTDKQNICDSLNRYWEYNQPVKPTTPPSPEPAQPDAPKSGVKGAS